MLEETEKASEIQSVERPSSQEEKNRAATVGQNQHIDRKEKIYLWSKNDTHKIRGLHRVKRKTLFKISAGSV
jgi:hypothetical protein